MIYPRLPENEDKRRKLTSEQIDEIRKMHESGMSLRAIAAIFNVSKTIVGYHCSNKKDEINKRRYECLKEQEERDPEFREKRQKDKQKYNAELLVRSEEKRKYKGKATYKWKKKKYHDDPEFREKTQKQARESYKKKSKL